LSYDPDEMLKTLTDAMIDANAAQKKMGANMIDHRAHLIAIEKAVLAIAEQLAANGRLDVGLAELRVKESAASIEHDVWREKVKPHAESIAARLGNLATPDDRPPRGSKPRLVKK